MNADIITDNDVTIKLNILSSCLILCMLLCMAFDTYKAFRYPNLDNLRKIEANWCNYETLVLLLSLLGCISDYLFRSRTYINKCCFVLCLIIVLMIVKQKTERSKEKKVAIVTVYYDYLVEFLVHNITKLFWPLLFSLTNVLRCIDNYNLQKNDVSLANDGSLLNNPFNANSVSNPHVTYPASGSHVVIDSKHGNTFADNLGLQNLLATPLIFHGERYYANLRCNNVADYYNSFMNIGLKYDVRININKPRKRGITLTEITDPLLHNFSFTASGLRNSTLNKTDRQSCSISVQDSMPFTEMTFYGINHVIRRNPGERFTYELSDFFTLQKNDKIIYKINNQSVHKIQEKHFLSGCSIFTYLYKTMQSTLEAVTGLDRKNDLQKRLDICVPYDAMGHFSLHIKKEVTRDDHTNEIDLIWTAYILPLKTLPRFKTYLPPNFNSTYAEWLYWQEVNQDAILHWSITLLYEILFCACAIAIFAKRLIDLIIGQFINLRRFLNRRKRCITGLTFDCIILTSERDNKEVYDIIVSPLKQFGYKVCFPPIDALPGGSKIATLFKLANKSSKFILVTSPNFKEGSPEWRFMYEALVAQRYLNYELTYTDVIVVGLRGNVPNEITHTLNKVKIIHNFLGLSRPSRGQELLKISSDIQISGFYFASMIDIIDWFLLTFPDFEI